MRPSYKELDRENPALKGRLEQLEVELRRGRRQAAAFSPDEHKSDSKRPGRNPDQGHFSWPKPPREEEIHQATIAVSLPRCPDCGRTLIDRVALEEIQIDLPQVKPLVARFLAESG